jgi:RNA polymerase sigma factor (sigma-70 family)
MTSAVEQLIVDNEPLVRHTVTKMYHGLRQSSMEDLLSAGLVGLWQAAQRYRPERGRFSTYACRRIRGAIIDYLRETSPGFGRSRSDSYTRPHHSPLHFPSDYDSSDIYAVEDHPESGVLLGEILSEVEEVLLTIPDRDAAVYRSVLGGARHVDVAKDHGIHPARVSQIVKSVREDIRLHFLRVGILSPLK